MIEEINSLDRYLEDFSKIATLSKFDPFIQKIISLDNLDYKSVEGLKEIAAVRELAIIINYYGGSQFIIMKRNLEKKYNRELSDSEVISKAKKMKTLKISRYLSYNIDVLSSYDRADIYQNIKMIFDLKDKKAFNCENFDDLDEALVYLENFDFSMLANKFACITNVKQKILFDEYGMQNYLNKIIPEIMNKQKTKK